jgi:hypothetical protein
VDVYFFPKMPSSVTALHVYHILGYVLSYKEIVKWDDVDGSII